MEPSDTPATNRTRLVVALLIGAVGLVWVLQGFGLLPGSFMTGDRFWALMGGALMLGALIYGLLPRIRRR